MAKKNNILNFLGGELGDDNLRDHKVDMSDVGSNKVPTRTDIPLTHLTTKNNLSRILDGSKRMKPKKKR